MTRTDVQDVTAVPEARLRGQRLTRVGLAAAMLSRLTGRLVGILLVIVLARDAAPATVAVYGYLLGTASLMLVLTDLGVASVAGRDVASGHFPAAAALRAALPAHGLSVLVAGIITAVLTLFTGPDATPPGALLLTVAFVVLGGMNNLWADLLRGAGRVLFEGALEIGSTVLLVVAGVLVVWHGGGILPLTAVVAGKEAVVLVVSWCALRPRRDPAVRTRALLARGMWVAICGTVGVLMFRAGTLVLGGMGSVGALATYVVATRFLDAGGIVAHTVGFGLGPGLATLAADPPAFRATARRYLAAVGLLGVAVAVIGVLVAGPITTIPFGERWVTAVPAVRMAAVTALPVLLLYVCFTVLMARNQVRWMAISTLGGTVVGVTTTIALVAARPTALSGVIGTTAGATALTLLLLWGLRDLLRRS